MSVTELPEGPDEALPIGTMVDGFRICGRLGEGAMGEVYLAQDVVLGRRVALKLIRRVAMNRDGLERFLGEARTTASFNHPNIVTLHAFGEHAGRPYLALEHVDGESLRSRMASGPLPAGDAARYARAIAEAIAEAHRHGLVHADLKPENVVIARDGRVRVVDFGLARLAGDGPGPASGTPAYMSPERWRGAVPDGAIDVWALGVMLHEKITGARPFGDAALARMAFDRPELIRLPSTPWAAIVTDCLADPPEARPSAADLVGRLRVLDARPVVRDGTRSPYPGLAVFGRDDATAFFGRGAELEAMIEQLRTNALIPVVGPSGIGKSSFVRAAVAPRLSAAGGWTILELRPGDAPFDRLAALVASTAFELRTHPASLSLAMRKLAHRLGTKTLLILDQFEEVFTLDRGDAAVFCDSLATSALPDEPWRIALTIRDDFLGRLATTAIRSHLGAVLPLAPMGAADLRAAIAGPLQQAGYEPDAPELVSRIVADVQDQPACLPLLQFACAALWERRDVDRKCIRASDYEAMGRASGALASHAQKLLSELTSHQVRLARALLLSLVGRDGTRRPRVRTELLDEIALPEAPEVLDRLLERRLVVVTRDTERDTAQIELAHEALATAWPQLARWLDETYEERALVAELEEAAGLWDRRGRRDDETWTGPALAEAVRKVDAWNVMLSSRHREFLDAGVRQVARDRRRRRWLFALVLGALATAAVGATIAAITMVRRQRDAEERQAVERVVAADRGIIEMVLEPFDWDPASQRAVAPKEHPDLHWRLRASDATGREYLGDDLERGMAVWRDGGLAERVEARSGPAVLEIARGPCAPSIIRLIGLPGYAQRSTPTTMRIRVPTCAASQADMAQVSAGEFLLNVDASEGQTDDRPMSLPAFDMDRTEVTRGAFAIYESMSSFTGESATPAPHLDLERLGGPRAPAMGVTFETARNYCRYLGKDLPTIEQWQKAVRGGLSIDGSPNPAPKRDVPWLRATSDRPTNVRYSDDDRSVSLAPVDTFPDDRSPYGIVDLLGNVSEWTLSHPPSSSSLRELRNVAGANWTLPVSLASIRWRNNRPDRTTDFAIGLRCVR